MSPLPITRVVLYKHGVGYLEREGSVEGDAALSLVFKQAEVSDVLKSLTVLDLDGGHIASVSYDSTKPLEQLLADVALSIPDKGSVVGLLPQIKGARVSLHTGVSDPVEGAILGVDTSERQTGDGIVKIVLISILTDAGDVRAFDLHNLAGLRILDAALRRDLDYYLRTQLSSKKKDARTFTLFAQGQGRRTIRLSYILAAPVWKATYRILLGEEGKPPMIQGWAVVDNTQDEDWENVSLSLVAGLPVSFVHDLYTPRYVRRPEVKVQETTGVLPPKVAEGFAEVEALEEEEQALRAFGGGGGGGRRVMAKRLEARSMEGPAPLAMAISSTPTQVRERKIGDLFEYQIEHPVTIRRNQSALVPIVLRGFEGRPVLLYNKETRRENPLRSVEFKNTTGLTLEGGPVTVMEGGNYVGEAMLDTLKPDEQRLIPYAVELSVSVLDNADSQDEKVHRVVIRNGVLRAYYGHVQQTTYILHNKGSAEQVLYLEHPRQAKEWKLFDTAEPREITENHWRFCFPLPGAKTSRFAVRQKRVLERLFVLTDVKEGQLSFWLEERYLDQKTAKVLGDVLALRQEAGKHEEETAHLEKEREQIHNEQKRIRENLQALGDRPSEKDLRERWVRTLNTQEDRLEKIDTRIKELFAARARCQETVDELLAKLEYEGTVA